MPNLSLHCSLGPWSAVRWSLRLRPLGPGRGPRVLGQGRQAPTIFDPTINPLSIQLWPVFNNTSNVILSDLQQEIMNL
jgi:hypothetical protein